MRRITFETLAFGIFLIVFTAYTAHAISYPRSDYEENIQWSDVPALAKETIVVKGEGGHIDGITKEVKSGSTFYNAEVETPDGRRILLKVEEAGELVDLRYKNGSDNEDSDIGKPSSPTR